MSNILCDSAREKGATNEQIARIFELDTYLGHTDYVVIKLYEASVTAPSTVDALRAQYADILTERSRSRTELSNILDSLEGQS